MREIKFRAFHKEAKEMYWFDVMNGNHSQGNGYIGMALFGEPITKERYRDRMILVDPMECEIMQFTGLKDQKGVEIYEGDILNLTFNEDFKNNDYLNPADVVFSNLDYTYCVRTIKNTLIGLPINWGGYSCVEVIGNIYQNTELL